MDSNNDIGNMLSKLLEDPSTLASVMSIAGNLMNNLPKESAPREETKESAGDSIPAESGEPEKETVPTANFQSVPDLSAISALAGLAGGSNKKSDPRCNLLNSLRPFMGHGRDEKIDMMIKALSLAELAGGFLNNKKLF